MELFPGEREADNLIGASDVDGTQATRYYLAWLTQAYQQNQTDQLDEIFEHLKKHAEDTKPKKARDGWSAQYLRRRRHGRTIISFYDLFRASIVQWQASDESTHLEAVRQLNCSPITQLIWERAKDEIWDGGALHACAEHGLHIFIRLILNFMRAQTKKDNVERAKIMFLTGPDSEYTPLGIAIWRRQLDCLGPLLEAKGVEEYINQGYNNVLTDQSLARGLLHDVIAWTNEELPLRVEEDRQSTVEGVKSVLEKLLELNKQLLVKVNDEGLSPYGYAKSSRETENARGGYRPIEIEEFLRYSIFKHLKSPEDIRKALYGTTDQGKEIGLDLSDFNFESHHFGDFVTELEAFEEYNEQKKSWVFEDTLLYLNLPCLREDCSTDVVNRLLQLLRQKKGVKTIVNVKLPDTSNKYSNKFVVDLLSTFTIRRFDWIRLDTKPKCFLRRTSVTGSPGTTELQNIQMYSYNEFKGVAESLSILNTAGFRQVQEISLCLVGPNPSPTAICSHRNAQSPSTPASSGSVRANRDAFPQLGSQYPIQEAQDARTTALKGFRYNNGNMRFSEGLNLSWNGFIMKSRVIESALSAKIKPLTADLRNCHRFLAEIGKITQTPVGDEKLQHCVHVLEKKRVKVAIVDNGVDFMRESIQNNIESGMSFVKVGGDTEMPYLPWYTAADPHGTQMAYLVTSMNPWCRILAARVGVLQNDIDVKATIEAIEWALTQKVDIISISWIVSKQHEALRQVIKKATDNKVLVFCSTADIGCSSIPDMYPASYDEVIAVSASNALGMPRLESFHDVHIMLGGDNIAAHGPKFMRHCAESSISGSSVATALAAGLASLCLFLARMANLDGKGENFKDRLTMLKVFGSMQSGPRNRVVAPAKLLGDAFGMGDNINFSAGGSSLPEGLEKHFGFHNVHNLLAESRERPFNGDVPRRDSSRLRARGS